MSKLACKYKGLFPDPIHCNKYFICGSSTGDAISKTCPGKSNYDYIKKICTTATVTCPNFQMNDPKSLCNNKNGLVAYPNDPSIFVECTRKSIGTLFSCDSPDMKVNVKSYKKSCDYNCKGEGFFASPSKDNKYLVCVKEGTNFTSTEETCDGGKFSAELGFCVSEDKVEGTTESPSTS